MFFATLSLWSPLRYGRVKAKVHRTLFPLAPADAMEVLQNHYIFLPTLLTALTNISSYNRNAAQECGYQTR